MIGFLAYAILSRLAYVLYVGLALRREELYGPSGDFRRFRRRAAFVMNNDAVAFFALCLATGTRYACPCPSPHPSLSERRLRSSVSARSSGRRAPSAATRITGITSS